MKKHYKNIEEAMKIERPDDIVVKVLSNKFAVVMCALVGGKHDTEKYVMGINGGTTVFSFGNIKNLPSWCKEVESRPNIEPIGWWLINPQTKKEYYKIVNTDYRKYKQDYRKISKLI
jgi:hypothetical protein